MRCSGRLWDSYSCSDRRACRLLHRVRGRAGQLPASGQERWAGASAGGRQLARATSCTGCLLQLASDPCTSWLVHSKAGGTGCRQRAAASLHVHYRGAACGRHDEAMGRWQPSRRQQQGRTSYSCSAATRSASCMASSCCRRARSSTRPCSFSRSCSSLHAGRACRGRAGQALRGWCQRARVLEPGLLYHGPALRSYRRRAQQTPWEPARGACLGTLA